MRVLPWKGRAQYTTPDVYILMNLCTRMRPMLVSFIIPHKGREELLERTIQSVLDLEFDLQKLEVIVVTQNKSLECAHIDRKKIQLTVLFRSEQLTISALRNAGVEQASGEYLVFLDADIQLSPNWLTTMFRELDADPNRVLISSMQRCEPDAGIIEKLRVKLNNAAADSAVQFLDGRNLFLHRNTFQKAGGFPEHLVTCEDYYFTNTVHQLGEVYFTSQTTYVHLGEDKNYPEMFKKEIWRGQSNLQSLKGRKLVLREIPSILTPLWQTFFALVALVTLLLGHVTLVLFSLVMLCIPIILYSLRLYHLGNQTFRVSDTLWFYCVYFSARAIGTTLGLFKSIRI